MRNIVYQIAKGILSVVYKFTNTSITIRGKQHISKDSTIYVANHFTNIETLLLPYILNKVTTPVRSLAKDELFNEKTTKYLHSLGVFSVKTPRRDDLIIRNLILNRYNWIIYPEGMMVKNKKVINKNNKLFLKSPYYSGRPKTGATVLAIKSYLKLLFLNKNPKKNQDYLKTLNLTKENKLAQDIFIQPITITFYPMRVQDTFISKISTIIGNPNERSLDELRSESSMLLKGNTLIYFHEPISIKTYLSPIIQKRIWFLSQEMLLSTIINSYKWTLTREFMKNIYHKVFINIDHLFIFYLYHTKQKSITSEQLKYFIYTAYFIIRKDETLNYHPHMEDCIKMFTLKKWKPFQQILSFSLSKKLLYYKNNKYLIDTSFFKRPNMFQKVRSDNPFIVIYNEISPLKQLSKPLIKVISKTQQKHNLLLDYTLNFNLNKFHNEHQQYHDHFSKKEKIGIPRFYKNSQSSIAIVMNHGYLASPMELDLLANVLKKDYTIYQLRLTAHGTNHTHLKEVHFHSWIYDNLRSILSLKRIYDKVIVLGFSTGATISLYNYFNTTNLIDGLILLSPALYLSNKKSNFVPSILLWNSFSRKLKLEKLIYDDIKNDPTYPETNYVYNHIKGVDQLNKLIKKTKQLMSRSPSIHVPSLVIHSKNDTVIKSKSAEQVYNKIQHPNKELYLLSGNNHIIVRGTQYPTVLNKIQKFLKKNY